MPPARFPLAWFPFVALLVLPTSAIGQTFVRITNPANPVVTDAYQSGGGCFVDLVGDGYLDLFVANGNLTNQPNALYRNDRAGGFVKVTTGPVVQDGGSSIGGTLGDFDSDGRLDLFVTNRNSFGNFLYRGLGDTSFSKVTTGSPVTDLSNSNSGSWVDLDNDGDLDLYVINFQGNDFLYRNDGPPTYGFTRVDTTALTAGSEFSIPGAWADFNDDGLPDLFVGNAGAQNDYLYVNHGNLFFTRTVFTDGQSTLGASFGDYDNDGHLDLFVAHFSGQTGTLYHNSGPPTFALVPVAGIVSSDPGSWVGSAWGDYDNDGSLDLLVAQDGGSCALYHNDGPPSYGFTKVVTGPIATDVGNAFGAVWGDYDRDGQLDLFVSDHLANGNRLYRNLGTANHWLTVRCKGKTSNRAGIGARIRIDATVAGVPRRQLREVTGQTGYNSQNLDQHFGLAGATVADSLVITWPSGHRDGWSGVALDRVLVLEEGSGTIGVGEPIRVEKLWFETPIPNPSGGKARIRFHLPREGRARLEVFDARGRLVFAALDRWLPAGSHESSVALSAGTPLGLYFCRLTTADGSARVKLVLAR